VTISAPGVGVAAAWTEADLVGFSGTSAAVPFVSGAIAYLLSENPGMTATEAMDLLVFYADDAGAPGKDEVFGNGILNMRRVMERNQKGIYDVVAGDIYVLPRPANDSNMKIVLSAQNRGTETVTAVNLKAEVSGVGWSKNFRNVEVGKTISLEIPVNYEKAKSDGTIGVSFSASLVGANDMNSANNARKALVFVGGNQQ